MGEETPDIDEVDLGVLHFLQEDARNYTTAEIAEELDISASTVSNRIRRLEEQGVIEGYQPVINYGKAGFPFFVLVVCTRKSEEIDDRVTEALEIEGVVNVRSFLSGTCDFRASVVGRSTAEISQSIESLRDLGLRIENVSILDQEITQPFNHFYTSSS